MPATRITQERFKSAYRLARLAIRGLERQSVKIDLNAAPDYSPNCRRCNAGVKVTSKVMAALSREDGLVVAIHAQAVRIAFGEPAPRSRSMPAPLDFDGWQQQRQWWAQVREAA